MKVSFPHVVDVDKGIKINGKTYPTLLDREMIEKDIIEISKNDATHIMTMNHIPYVPEINLSSIFMVNVDQPFFGFEGKIYIPFLSGKMQHELPEPDENFTMKWESKCGFPKELVSELPLHMSSTGMVENLFTKAYGRTARFSEKCYDDSHFMEIRNESHKKANDLLDRFILIDDILYFSIPKPIYELSIRANNGKYNNKKFIAKLDITYDYQRDRKSNEIKEFEFFRYGLKDKDFLSNECDSIKNKYDDIEVERYGYIYSDHFRLEIHDDTYLKHDRHNVNLKTVSEYLYDKLSNNLRKIPREYLDLFLFLRDKESGQKNMYPTLNIDTDSFPDDITSKLIRVAKEFSISESNTIMNYIIEDTEKIYSDKELYDIGI